MFFYFVIAKNRNLKQTDHNMVLSIAVVINNRVLKDIRLLNRPN